MEVTLSAGLTRARGARAFEGDPAGANPSVDGQNINESTTRRILEIEDRQGSYEVSNGPAYRGSVGDHGNAAAAADELYGQHPAVPWQDLAAERPARFGC